MPSRRLRRDSSLLPDSINESPLPGVIQTSLPLWNRASDARRSRFGFDTRRHLIQFFSEMICRALGVLMLFAAMVCSAFAAPPENTSLLARHWYEARAPHFSLYSCGPTQEVAKLAARLEQFHDAYAQLAGVRSVASPPIIVTAFPDHASLMPFLPLYDGKAANLDAFFLRGEDENLISLGLTQSGNPRGMQSIYHEYTHLLLRQNSAFWPLWLVEGMAEIYSTFEAEGHLARIGKPIDHHIRLLSEREFLPLHDLLAVDHKSPEYNERDRQGVFYAESWLLTHYLMLGDNAVIKSRFGKMTTLLREHQTPEQAFTNALGVSLPVMDKALHRYLDAGRFTSFDLSVKDDLSAPKPLATFPLAPAFVCFRLGDQLVRIGRADEARPFFERAKLLAPKSPLPFEGLAMVASHHDDSGAALQNLGAAIELGSTSFLVHFNWAREKYTLLHQSSGGEGVLDPKDADALRAELKRSIALMPDFARSYALLAAVESEQSGDFAQAENFIQKAIQLDADNQNYLFALAVIQYQRNQPAAARQTLTSVRLSELPPTLKESARKLTEALNGSSHASP